MHVGQGFKGLTVLGGGGEVSVTQANGWMEGAGGWEGCRWGV